MSSISSVGGYGGYSPYSTMASGAVNKASQDASGSAIQEKTKAVENETEKKPVSKAEEKLDNGALSGVEDYIKEVKEKSEKSLNGTLSAEEKQSVSEQIKEYVKENNEETKTESSGDGSDKKTGGMANALSYNSPKAMELNGNQVDKKEDVNSPAAQEVKAKQAADSYQSVVQQQQQQQKQQDVAQKSMATFV